MRKPGAFAHYRYQQSLFPRLLFRVAYDLLREHYPRTADRQYLKILHLAAGESEERVEQALRQLVEQGDPVTFGRVQLLVDRLDDATSPPAHLVQVRMIELTSYDCLLRMSDAPEVAQRWTP